MARSTWAGAIDFGGFPISVKAYALLKSKTAAQSFKTLCPCHHEPITRLDTCGKDGTVIKTGTSLEPVKGVEVSNGKYQALPLEAVEQITDAERSIMLEPAGL